MFAGDTHLQEVTDIIDLAVSLAVNEKPDLANIHTLGEGWGSEENLVIAIYCSLRHQDDFSAGVIVAVNHRGDSDSTGAVTGNILGVLLGYEAIDEQWKHGLEHSDVILKIADDSATVARWRNIAIMRILSGRENPCTCTGGMKMFRGMARKKR